MISIIGMGTVGRSMFEVFPDASIHDPAKGYEGPVGGTAFVCVPTPSKPDGSCDTSIVEKVIATQRADLFVIRSTVPPGTCRSLAEKYEKLIVFQPEYLGMTAGHRYRSDRDVPFVILGGTWGFRVADLYKTALPSETAYHLVSWEAAELVKYAVNTFLATKVEFANELRELGNSAGVDYDTLRELWLLDPRIGRSHSQANGHGFDGACFPKDIAALVGFAERAGVEVPVIRAAMTANVERQA